MAENGNENKDFAQNLKDVFPKYVARLQRRVQSLESDASDTTSHKNPHKTPQDNKDTPPQSLKSNFPDIWHAFDTLAQGISSYAGFVANESIKENYSKQDVAKILYDIANDILKYLNPSQSAPLQDTLSSDAFNRELFPLSCDPSLLLAIKHCKDVAKSCENLNCGLEHYRLAHWLFELAWARKDFQDRGVSIPCLSQSSLNQIKDKKDSDEVAHIKHLINQHERDIKVLNEKIQMEKGNGRYMGNGDVATMFTCAKHYECANGYKQVVLGQPYKTKEDFWADMGEAAKGIRHWKHELNLAIKRFRDLKKQRDSKRVVLKALKDKLNFQLELEKKNHLQHDPWKWGSLPPPTADIIK